MNKTQKPKQYDLEERTLKFGKDCRTFIKKLPSFNEREKGKFPKEWTQIHFKTYPRLKKIKLGKSTNTPLSRVLKQRRSKRTFSGDSISKKDFDYILFNSSGIVLRDKSLDETRRPYPSAGARYPLEIYSLILNCKNLKKGLYHYNVKDNLIELLMEGSFKKWLKEATGGEKNLNRAAVIFIITGVLKRTEIKYKERGYRYILMEVGALAQNLCLLATELGLGSYVLGGYIDKMVDEFLDVSLQKEYSLCLIAIGKIQK